MTLILVAILAFATVVLSFGFAGLALVLTRERAEARQPSQSGPAPADPGGASETMSRVLSEVERLAELRERGVLTDKEFAAQKAKFLRLENPRPQRSSRAR